MRISADHLRSLLTYDPETGWFVRPDGERAGRLVASLGYRKIRVVGVDCYEHRLAWLYVHGQWPANQIDHANGIKDDNRLSNLREATMRQQRANSPRYKNNTSGFKGVYRLRGKWAAKIYVEGRQIHLGTFADPVIAHDAYASAARKHFAQFARAF